MLAAYLSMERHLQQHIPELVRKLIGIPVVYRIRHLIGLLHQIARKRFMRLLPVPRAAVNIPQTAHYI